MAISQIFKTGGGAGIGSYVLVWENDKLLNPNAERIRWSYDSGENLYLSIIDDVTEEALLPLNGFVDNDGILHLYGRDFDDAVTYEFLIGNGNESITVNKIDGIALGDTIIDPSGSVDLDYATIEDIDSMFVITSVGSEEDPGN